MDMAALSASALTRLSQIGQLSMPISSITLIQCSQAFFVGLCALAMHHKCLGLSGLALVFPARFSY